MQFISNGPQVPEQLLQAHEDGRVAFFCGAGISRPAGLPDFKGLVKKLYCKLKENPIPIEEAAIDSQHYDRAIGLLEGRLQGGRRLVRKHLPSILNPDLTKCGATETHGALLTLARTRKDRLRLVTTNFDRLFEIAQGRPEVDSFTAPLLPIPKSRLNGIVHLHGVLPAHPHPDDLDKLVLSSGDFGLAYLTEAWAARFVSELFRNFTVCFVGYSIADPVLRYMTDALAADRLLGESHREMFAFGSVSEGEQEWRAKNVTPILYQEDGGHSNLHNTLRAWSGTYRDGLLGKEQIVVSFAGTDPRTSSEQDDFVGRMLWALADPSGAPAKRFSSLNPVPRLEWLEALEPLFHRPPQESHSPPLALVGSDGYVHLDQIVRHLGLWLTRHLNDPRLVLWLAKEGGRLTDQFRDEVEHTVNRLDGLEREDNQEELDSLRELLSNVVDSRAPCTM